MGYIGDYLEDYATLNFKFTTRSALGVPTALAGGVVKVYKANETDTEINTGVTLAADFDGVTGLNNVLIDLSAAAFYAVANDYAVIITTGTVNGVSVVGEVVGTFSIENRFNETVLANGAHGGGAATITLQTPIAATVPDTQKVDVETIKTKAVAVDAGGTTFAGTVASPTNITAATGIVLANAAHGGAGATLTLQTPVQAALANVAHGGGAATIAAAITGNITGNLSGSVGSVAGNVTGTVTGKTPAEAGDAMTLAADAIKAVSYDESTAFPLKSADTGATQVARVGADSDTLETLSDQIDGVATLGAGAIEWTYTLTETGTGDPVADAHVWVTTDAPGNVVVASGTTDQDGKVVFQLDGGTVYVWRSKTGWVFSNPDTETVA